MGMSESGRAIGALLAALAGREDESTRNLRRLRTMGVRGGRHGLTVVDTLIETGARNVARVRELERDLEHAQSSIRAMVGAGRPHDRREPIDPPAGHQWLSSMPILADPQPYDGRLYCATCTGREAEHTTSTRIVLAAECLERDR
jgi:hypothetical protein